MCVYVYIYVCVCVCVCIYIYVYIYIWASLVARVVKNPPTMQETWVQTLVGKVLWRKEWLPTPAFLPGEFYGQRSLVGYSPWGLKESDTTERLTHTPPQGDNRYGLAHRPDSSTTGKADTRLSTKTFKALMMGVSGCMKAMLW